MPPIPRHQRLSEIGKGQVLVGHGTKETALTNALVRWVTKALVRRVTG